MSPRPSTLLSIPANWDDALGVIITLLDANDEEVEDIDDAHAAEWVCMTGAYEGQHFVIGLDELELVPIH